MKSLRGISVVIPTYGRTDMVKDLLESLYKQEKFQEFEVIIVDSSSSPVNSKIEDMCKSYGAKYIWNSDRRPSVNRNIGIRESKYDIILFIDSDCIATPNLLSAHYEKYKTDNIGGVVGLTKFIGPSKIGYKLMENTPFILPFKFALMRDEALWGPTSNISFRRDVLLQVGGFDESLPIIAGGEDVDIGWKVVDAGYTIKTNPKAVVIHRRDTWNGLKDAISRSFRWGRADYYLVQKHPRRKIIDYPKFSIILFFLTMLSFFTILNNRTIIILLLPVISLFLYLCITALFGDKYNKGYSFFYRLGGRFLMLVFEIGYVVECFLHIDFKHIFLKPLHHKEQIITTLRDDVARVWAELSSTLAFFFLFILFIL